MVARMMAIDLYSTPHKALRAAVNRAGTLLAATDGSRLLDDLVVVRAVIDDLRRHAEHEDENAVERRMFGVG